jgi:hypothetical protein
MTTAIHDFTIIMEWENVLLSEDDRIYRVLRALKCEIHNYKQRYSRADAAIPMLVMYQNAWGTAAITAAFGAVWGEEENDIQLKMIGAGHETYYEMKNIAARSAETELVVYLDSDVIPQPNWLVNILEVFETGEYDLVFGLTVIDHVSFYTRSFSLVKLSLPVENPAVVEPEFGFANNFCARREIIVNHPWPDATQTFKVANIQWQRMLKSEGYRIALNQQAVVFHPPPLPRNLLSQGFFHGRDEVLDRFALRQAGADSALPGESHTFFGRAELNVILNRLSSPFLNYRRVNMPLWQVPFAFIYVVVYYTSLFSGYLLTYLFPGYSMDRFNYYTMTER